MRIFVVVATISLFLLSHCSKDLPTGASKNTRDVTGTSLRGFHKEYSAAYGNSSNPYDFIGVYHNKSCENVADYCTYHNWLLPEQIDSVILLVHSYISSQLWYTIPGVASYTVPEIIPYTIALSIDSARVSCTLDTVALHASHIVNNSLVGEYLDELISLCFDTTRTSDFIDDIKQLELNFICDSIGMTEIQKVVFFSAASTARYSFGYWTDTTRVLWPIEGGSIGIHMSKEKKEDNKKPGRVAKVVGQDCIGTITGACEGFVGGAIAGAIGGLLMGGGPVV